MKSTVEIPPTKKVTKLVNRSSGSDFFIPKAATLRLRGGKTFSGTMAKGYKDSVSGEVVFTTGMTGYDLSLTDPSYAGQILVFTYPLIGNYGISPQPDWESGKIHAVGVVVSQACLEWSHSHSVTSLQEWLRAQSVPLMTGVDTRALTKYIRQHGAIDGSMGHAGKTSRLRSSFIPRVSINQPQIYNPTRTKTIIVVDCGMKENILRHFQASPYRIKRVPWDYDYSKEAYDAIFLTNGPGDPADYQTTTTILAEAMKKNKPIFGICLGSQLMGIAAGAKTYKLPFGHRSHNQPCQDLESQRAYITSQNHGYAVDEKSLPRGWAVTFRNLNDNSVEGIRHTTKPFFAVQFHPEANPGPVDTEWLFERFYKLI